MSRDLEQRLHDLATVIDFPPTPDLAGAVERCLASAPPAARRPVLARRRTLLWAAVILLVAATAAAAAAYRIWTDVPGVVVREVPAVPAVPPGAGLGLGQRTTTDAAAATAGFGLRVPDDALGGPPGAVYLADTPGRPRVSLVWAAGEGLPPLPGTELGAVLTAFPGGTVGAPAIEKMTGPATRFEPVHVGDGAAWWIEGAPHLVVFETPGGDLEAEERRLAGNVLIWQQDGLVLRLEAQTGRDAALALATGVAVERR